MAVSEMNTSAKLTTFICFCVALLAPAPPLTAGKNYDRHTHFDDLQRLSYTQGLMNIRMSKFSEPPTESSQKLMLKRNQSVSEDFAFKIGGLGLTSSIHNRISLGSLSNAAISDDHRNRVSKVESQPISKAETVTPVWPTVSTKGTSFGKVHMRIMGQAVDSRVTTHLHPDTTPYNAKKLRKILGDSLDKDWTSETAPRILRQRGISGAGDQRSDGFSSQPDIKLIKEAHALNFTFRHEPRNPLTLSESQLILLRNWLIDKATCEMEYIWEDLGLLFWPRWIRRGVCVNRPGHSCSWPPGMKCRPSGSRALQLLHWKCEDATDIHSRKEAAEQRNRRRTAANTFQSKFFEMKPVELDINGSGGNTGRVMQSRFSLRDTHAIISLSGHSDPRLRIRRPSPDEWGPQQTDTSATGFSSDQRRKRRTRRLIKRLSVTTNGYHCHWQVQKYLISDRCACSCS